MGQWIRIKNQSLTISLDKKGFFTKVNGFEQIGDAFVLSSSNDRLNTYYNSGIMANKDYDYGTTRLPKGTKRLVYTLNRLGLLESTGLDAVNSKNERLDEAFFGIVLFDIQDRGGVSELFEGGIEMNLCIQFHDEKEWSPHKHCAGMATNLRTNAPEYSEFPIFWSDFKLLGDEQDDHVGYYLIPFLLPEKMVGYHVIVASPEAYLEINKIWFAPIQRYRTTKNKIKPFVTVEVDRKCFKRSDEHGIYYVDPTDDPTINEKIALALISDNKQF